MLTVHTNTLTTVSAPKNSTGQTLAYSPFFSPCLTCRLGAYFLISSTMQNYDTFSPLKENISTVSVQQIFYACATSSSNFRRVIHCKIAWSKKNCNVFSRSGNGVWLGKRCRTPIFRSVGLQWRLGTNLLCLSTAKRWYSQFTRKLYPRLALNKIFLRRWASRVATKSYLRRSLSS